MTPLTIGMFILLAVGIAAAVVALVLFLRKGIRFRMPIAAAMFAILLLGLGTFGLAFMDPYTRLLGTLVGTTGNASDTPKYAEFFTRVANGGVGEEQTAVGLSHTLSNPIPNMDKVLEEAIASGTSAPGKQRLQSVLAAFKEKRAEAERAINEALPGSGVVPPGGPKTINPALLDPGVRKVVEHRLEVMPREELSKVALDPAMRRRIEAQRPR